MRKIIRLSLIVLLPTVCSAFQMAADQESPPFSGTWKGVAEGETSIMIEFSIEGFYSLSVDGKKLTENIEGWGKVKYEWGAKDDRYQIVLFGEKEPETNMLLEAFLQEDGQLQLWVFSDGGEAVSTILLEKI